MNRAKQLEALRGMKFMQRKEEAMRREAVEAHVAAEAAATGLHSATETAVTTAAPTAPAVGGEALLTSSSSGVVRATTILIEDRFDPLSHAMGRKRFAFRGPTQPQHAQGGASSPTYDSFSALAGDGLVDEANLWESVAPSSSTAGNIISMSEGSVQEDDSAIGRSARQQQQQQPDPSGLGGRRFTLKESVRAPPMPRRLEESMRDGGGNTEARDIKRLRAEFGIGERTNEERGGNNDNDSGDE